jgi:hypothetical protein
MTAFREVDVQHLRDGADLDVRSWPIAAIQLVLLVEKNIKERVNLCVAIDF